MHTFPVAKAIKPPKQGSNVSPDYGRRFSMNQNVRV